MSACISEFIEVEDFGVVMCITAVRRLSLLVGFTKEKEAGTST